MGWDHAGDWACCRSRVNRSDHARLGRRAAWCLSWAADHAAGGRLVYDGSCVWNRVSLRGHRVHPGGGRRERVRLAARGWVVGPSGRRLARRPQALDGVRVLHRRTVAVSLGRIANRESRALSSSDDSWLRHDGGRIDVGVVALAAASSGGASAVDLDGCRYEHSRGHAWFGDSCGIREWSWHTAGRHAARGANTRRHAAGRHTACRHRRGIIPVDTLSRAVISLAFERRNISADICTEITSTCSARRTGTHEGPATAVALLIAKGEAVFRPVRRCIVVRRKVVVCETLNFVGDAVGSGVCTVVRQAGIELERTVARGGARCAAGRVRRRHRH